MPEADEGAGSAQKRGKGRRNKNWTDPEIFAAVHAGLGTNEKLSTGRNGPERMNAMQLAFNELSPVSSICQWQTRISGGVSRATS